MDEAKYGLCYKKIQQIEHPCAHERREKGRTKYGIGHWVQLDPNKMSKSGSSRKS
jgi:hypothetical protein